MLDGVLQKALAQIHIILKKGDEHILREKVRAIEQHQLSFLAPRNFDNADPANVIKSMEKGFENLCVTLEDLGVQNPKRLTVFEFYSRMEYYKKKYKAAQQKSHK